VMTMSSEPNLISREVEAELKYRVEDPPNFSALCQLDKTGAWVKVYNLDLVLRWVSRWFVKEVDMTDGVYRVRLYLFRSEVSGRPTYDVRLNRVWSMYRPSHPNEIVVEEANFWLHSYRRLKKLLIKIFRRKNQMAVYWHEIKNYLRED